MSKAIVIIGGGIIGMLSAHLLTQHGHSVVLLDKGALGKESSWAGGGIISPLYPWRYPEEVSLLSAYGQQHYQVFCKTLHASTGIDPQWTPSGLLMPTLDEQINATAWAKNASIELQVLTQRSTIDAIAPQLHPRFEQALWMPSIAQIRNPRLLKALKQSLLSAKVDIREHTAVIDIQSNKNNAVTGVITTTGTINADKVIVTSGAWSAQFKVLQDIALHVKPVAGEMILFKDRPQRLQRIILHNGRYLIPRQDGRIICGSTLAFTEFDKHISNTAKQSLQQSAYQLAPFLKTAQVEHHWCGLRPGSPNGIPYIGEHPHINNLYINTGHYRYGVTMGIGSVQLLLDHMMGQTSFMDIERFSLQQTRLPSAEFLTSER